MAKIAHICPSCRRLVPANTRCACLPPKRPKPEALRPGYRAAYKSPTYTRNRSTRLTLAQSLCESCGTPLRTRRYPDGKMWECHHVADVRLFADPEQANAVDNLRVMCAECHKAVTREARRS